MQCNVNNAMNLVCNNTMQGTRKNIVRLEPSCRCRWCECFKKGPFAWKNNPLKMIAQFLLSPPLDQPMWENPNFSFIPQKRALLPLLVPVPLWLKRQQEKFPLWFRRPCSRLTNFTWYWKFVPSLVYHKNWAVY